MIYAILGALVVGMSLGIFGSGGSILTVPVLVYLLKHPDKTAIAESLGIVGSVALVASLPYLRARLIDWRLALVFGVPGMLGTAVGAWVSGFVPGYAQLLVFAVVMALAARAMWKRSAPPRAPGDRNSPSPTGDATGAHHASLPAAALQGVGVGLLTGFVGVGGGFLIVPALVLFGRLAMRRAVATSLVIIAMNAAAGLFKHYHELVDHGMNPRWDVMLVFVSVGIVGSFAGSALQGHINQRALQRGFAVFLIVMAGFIAVKESVSLFNPPAEPTAGVVVMMRGGAGYVHVPELLDAMEALGV